MSKDPASGFAHADERVIKEENGEFSLSAAPGIEGIVEAMQNTHIGTLRNYLSHTLERYDKGERTGVAEVIALTNALTATEKAVSRLGVGIITRETDVSTRVLLEAAAVIYEIILQADASTYSTDDMEVECLIAFKALRKSLRKFPVRFVHSYLFGVADEKAMEKERLEEELLRLRSMTRFPESRDSAMDLETRITVAEIRLSDATTLLDDANTLRQELEAKCNMDDGDAIILLKDAGIPASLMHRLACLMFQGFGFVADYELNV